MMKGALVGFGEVASRGHWPAYGHCPDVSIVAVVDPSAERRVAAEQQLPGIRAFASVADLAAAVHVDFVDICTPPAFHARSVLDAIARGWHVLCEKPFVLDVDNLADIRHRAEAAGVAVVPVHNWKYAPIIQRSTGLLAAGSIGRLKAVVVETSRVRAAPTAESGSNWRRDRAVAGGGIVMDHGWHAAYLVLHWMNARPLDVSAVLHHPAEGGVEDEARLTITFPEAAASILLTWNGAVRRNAMRLVGSLGEIRIDDDVLSVRVPGRKDEREVFPQALSAGSHHADWFSAMMPDVLAAFRQPQSSRPMLQEAADCLDVILRAYRSQATASATP
jgi:predicted dehydrogenase